MKIREYTPADHDAVVALIAAFRVELAAFRGHEREANLADAINELQEYLDQEFPIFIAEDDNTRQKAGYLVCRRDGNTRWGESLFVSPEFRRRGVAEMLYGKGEGLAQQLGEPTIYNWVHPNNNTIIAFLKTRGSDTLNLIEIRRALPEDKSNTRLRIGDHDYRY